MFRIKSLKDLCGRLPVDNEIFFLATENSFNAFTFIPYIISERQIIDELVVSSYSINSRIISSFARFLHKGTVRKVHMYLSDSLHYRAPKIIDQINSMLSCFPEVSVSYGWNHSKVSCMRAGNDFFIAEGSGNWSENAQNEQYILLNHPSIYEFRKEWIKSLRH